MLTRQFLNAFLGAEIFHRGLIVYQANRVYDMTVDTDPDTGIILIDAMVEGSNYYNDYSVNVTLSADANWIVDSECTCPYYESHATPCKHIAAVLIAYMNEQMEKTLKPVKAPVLTTNPLMKDILDSSIDEQKVTVSRPASPIELEAFVYGTQNHELNVEFKIHSDNGHKYIIQNITDFTKLVLNNEYKSYGKELAFIHSVEAFSHASQPLLDFLIDLSNQDDSYLAKSEGYYYGYSYSNYYVQSAKRALQLKGRYLDQFISQARKTIIYSSAYNSNNSSTMISIIDGSPDIHVAIEQRKSGCILSGTASSYMEGHNHTYYFQAGNSVIVCAPKEDKKFYQLLDLFSRNASKGCFIANSDLPSFSRHIFPLIQDKMQIDHSDLNPAVYVPPKPSFEIYLDLPQDNLITCELKAVYKDKSFNVFENTPDEDVRDEISEQDMDHFVSAWFNSFDPEKKRLGLFDDDDKIYTFLKEGIPALQDRATVFISEKLKKLQIKEMPKISIGVSVSNDLLQLDLITDTMSPKELADILSRYDHKKKYYRLKTGDFINIDQSLAELDEIKSSLSLSTSQLASGKINLPKYRSNYLDELSESDLSLHYEKDQSFKSMIKNMKDFSMHDYPLPHDIKAELRPYQKAGFNWLCALRDNGFAGLLADEMGLGKTLQVIAFLGAWEKRSRSLVVCPASLVYNWSSEIQKFLPSLPSRIITGSASVRRELISSSSDNEVLITSYDLLKRDIDLYTDISFSCEIIDEAQYIKNAGTQASKAVKMINAKFKIALTGTPIENRLSELWSIFDYLLPGFFYGYQKFRANYELPIVRDEDKAAEMQLRKMITPFVLRRLKKDVLQDLPDKLEEVYYAQMEGEQKQLYDARVQRLKLMLTKQSDQEFKENKLIVLAELTRLRQICCDPRLIYSDYTKNSAKADMCVDMIKNAVEAGHKILLFSQFTSMLEILTDRLFKEGLSYHLLEGSTPKKQRADMAEAFQKDDVPIFCISLKAGGTGLNLTAADIVIHYDPWWNTAVENQASDRAHRIGQKNVVSVYRLIIKDTIEERILNLQQSKNDLADKILSGEGMSSAKLTREDLLSIL
jgi:SNF2 family DNA or RNA helicase